MSSDEIARLFTYFENKFAAIDDRFNQVNRRFDQVDSRMDGIEKRLNDTQTELEFHGRILTRHEKWLHTIADTLELELAT